MPDHKILITSADGQTGHLTAELLLTDGDFNQKHGGLALLAQDPSKCEDLKNHAPSTTTVIPVDYANDTAEELSQKIVDSGADTLFLIPPAHVNKMEVVKTMLDATAAANVPRVCLLSSAGTDLAKRDKQPRMREFVDMETMFMQCKGDTSTTTGHSPVIIRAGFYAENLLLFNRKIQESGKLPLPIGKAHKFAPVALGDVALIAAVVLTSEGPQGFSDDIRGQLIIVTGPQLTSGTELATAASQSLSTKMEYSEIDPTTARHTLDQEADIDESEKEYILEFFSLVREGKTNYVSTLAYKMATGVQSTLPSEFFEVYKDEFRPKRRRTSTRGGKRGGKGHANEGQKDVEMTEGNASANPGRVRGHKDEMGPKGDTVGAGLGKTKRGGK